jgi:hypothetical protein
VKESLRWFGERLPLIVILVLLGIASSVGIYNSAYVPVDGTLRSLHPVYGKDCPGHRSGKCTYYVLEILHAGNLEKIEVQSDIALACTTGDRVDYSRPRGYVAGNIAEGRDVSCSSPSANP